VDGAIHVPSQQTTRHYIRQVYRTGDKQRAEGPSLSNASLNEG
jgi:hypothetical protein